MVLIASVPGLVVAYLLHLYMHDNDTTDSVFTRHILTYLFFTIALLSFYYNFRCMKRRVLWLWECMFICFYLFPFNFRSAKYKKDIY